MLLLLALACAPAPSPDGAAPGLPTGATPTGSAPTGTPAGTPTASPRLPEPTWAVTGDWSAWSSPQAVDLDGDGVLDLVTGHGSESPADPLATLGELRAHSGADGSLLWVVPARQELFASARFAELGGAVGPDVVVGGRHGELLAVEGATGDLLWEWPLDAQASRDAGWFNFYTAELLDDLDGDGSVELLLANGGDSLAAPTDPRPPGQLAILSGATGAVLGRAITPDGAETYCSPRLVDGRVVFGTGGETWAGGLYAATVDDVLAGDLSAAITLAEGGPKGVIGPAAARDLDGDGLSELVLATYGGDLLALDGATDAERWRVSLPDHETHMMPTLAELTGDGIPDVFIGFNAGAFPSFSATTWIAVDGATGAELWRDTLGTFATSGAVAVDRDGDGLDEVIFGANHGTLGLDLAWQPFQLDPVQLEAVPLGDPFVRGGVSAPWVGDLDGDGRLEIVLLTADMGQGATWRLARYDLDDFAPPSIAWGHYLGGSAGL